MSYSASATAESLDVPATVTAPDYRSTSTPVTPVTEPTAAFTVATQCPQVIPGRCMSLQSLTCLSRTLSQRSYRKPYTHRGYM